MDSRSNIITEKVEEFIEEHEIFSVMIMMIMASIILCHSFFDVYPMHTTTDELGAIVGAASLAGYDWSGVIDKSGYYGFGYYSLFAPLFKMSLSPVIIYRIILIVTRVLRGSLISVIAYYIGKHYYRTSMRIGLLISAVICTIPLHPNDDANIINDVVLDIFFWLIILIVCKILEFIEKGRCIKWILLYIMACFFSSFLHTRALVMIIASFLVLIGIMLYKRKRTLLLVLFAVPTTVLSNVMIKEYQKNIWKTSGENLRNASVSVTNNLSLGDSKTWEIWFDMLIGHVSVQTLLTGGLFLLAIIVTVKYLYTTLRQRKTGETAYINVVLAISILSMGAAFAAFMVSSWFTNMYNTWDTLEQGKIYHYKALTYVRYWNIFSMPFIYTGICIVASKKYRDCIKKTVCVGSLLILGFMTMIVPVIQNHSAAASFLYTYLTDRTEKVTATFYYKCFLICIIFVALALVIYYGKINNQWAILPILVLMVMGYNWANENYNKPITEKVSAMVLSSYEQKSRLEERGVNIGQIYAYDDRIVDSNWYIFSVLQFYFYEYRIEDEYPVSIDTDDIIITYARSEQIEKDFPQLECYQLDDNEVWYTNIELVGHVPVER